MELCTKEELHDYNLAEGLTDLESIEVVLADAFETGDADYISKALGIVCSAKGMNEIADETGPPLTLLYESVEKRNPHPSDPSSRHSVAGPRSGHPSPPTSRS